MQSLNILIVLGLALLTQVNCARKREIPIGEIRKNVPKVNEKQQFSQRKVFVSHLRSLKYTSVSLILHESQNK